MRELSNDKIVNKNKKIENTNINIPNNLYDTNNKKIFISHSSKDKNYGNILLDYMVKYLGLGYKQIFYTSNPICERIPLSEDIYESLDKAMEEADLCVLLLSNDYLESEDCKREAFIIRNKKKDYVNIFLPDFDFEKYRSKHPQFEHNKLGIDISNKDDKYKIIELKNKIEKMFGLSVDEAVATHGLDELEKNIQSLIDSTKLK